MTHPCVVGEIFGAVTEDQADPVALGEVEVALLGTVRILEGWVGAAVLVCHSGI